MKYSRGARRIKTFRIRRRRRNFVPMLTMILGVVLVGWLGVRFFRAVFSNVRSETASATIQILKGRAEFSLGKSGIWARAYSDQKFLTGDTVRTASNSHVSFELLGGNMIFLNENSELKFAQLEQKSSGKKIISLQLPRGQMWARVSDDEFAKETKSRFEVETDRMLLSVRGTIFDLSATSAQDVVRLVKGNIDVDIFEDEERKKTHNLKIGVGQKLVVNAQNLTLMRAGKDVLEIIDSEFIESEWHLKNLEKFSPQDAAQIRRRIEILAPRQQIPSEEDESTLKTSNEIGVPKILEPTSGIRVPANTDAIKIEGTAPLEALQIVINGYTLTKFQPGDRRWTYFASKKFGTLLPGENVYSVVAVSRDGTQSASSKITIFYEGTVTISEATGKTQEISIEKFSAPVVLKPILPDPSEPYQTSSDIVTITGLVDPKTNAVEVNGFRLGKFQPGQTTFSYIANARYGNLKIGENTFEIIAFGPDGKKSSTTIRIIYRPIEL